MKKKEKTKNTHKNRKNKGVTFVKYLPEIIINMRNYKIPKQSPP